MFTDWYGQQSCTAGRAAFITGKSARSAPASLKVGLPGAKKGMQDRDLDDRRRYCKAQGYVTGQFGKNHLGDRDEMLPTAHGFHAVLRHRSTTCNAEEEPENPDYFKDPALKQASSARAAVIHSWANPDGTQRIAEHRPADDEAHGNV